MGTSIMTTDGRTQRLIDFYAKSNMFMGIGRTTAWTVPGTPNEAAATQEKIEELVVIQRIITKKYVRDQIGGEIVFASQAWTEMFNTNTDVSASDISFDNASGEIRTVAEDFTVYNVGDKFQVTGTAGNNIIFTVTTVAAAAASPMVVTPAPTDESAGAAMRLRSNLKTNDVHHIFYQCDLDYDNGSPDALPVDIIYRQIGLLEDPYDDTEAICSGNTYLSASLSATKDFPAGTLHYVDNRVPVTRTASQKETISLIIEF